MTTGYLVLSVVGVAIVVMYVAIAVRALIAYGEDRAERRIEAVAADHAQQGREGRAQAILSALREPREEGW